MKSLFLSLALLTMTAQAQEPDLQKQIAEAGEKGREQFEKFYAEFVSPLTHPDPTTHQVLEAAKNLSDFLNSKGIYSLVVASERNHNLIRVRILPKKDWKRSLPIPNMNGTKSIWEQAAESEKSPEPHLLCKMAEDAWKCDITAEFYYYFAFATSGNPETFIGDYTWDRVFDPLSQMVMLPPNFFARPEETLELQAGFVFATVQHDFHNKRVARTASPFHVRADKQELARLPAYEEAIKRVKETLQKKLEASDDTQTKWLASQLSIFAEKAEHEARLALAIFDLLQPAYQTGEAKPTFDLNLDGTVYAKFQTGQLETLFYLVSLESAEDKNRSLALENQMSAARAAVTLLLPYFRQQQTLVESLISDRVSLEEKLKLLGKTPQKH